MKVGKPKSKRVSVRLRHKIEKASASKQRKQKKAAKTDPQWRSRLKKDPGIPNLFPYKAQLLAEIEEGKRRKAEEQMAKREMAKARRSGEPAGSAPGQIEAESRDEADGGVTVLRPEEEAADMDVDEQNPMAALLASAQARANNYDDDDDDDDEEEEEEEEEDAVGDGTWNGIDNGSKTATTEQKVKRTLPKRALEDPSRAIALLISKIGTQQITDYYQLPALVTSATDISTRLLVEVARKRGRLGRGGVPNLHAAALVILNDINDERLQLQSSNETKKGTTGSVKIVKTMSAPFRLDGLWGDKGSGPQAMAVDG